MTDRPATTCAVIAGQMLVRLDDPDLRFALRTAELASDRVRLVLEARRLDADDARTTAKRMAALASNGAVNGQAARDLETAAEPRHHSGASGASVER